MPEVGKLKTTYRDGKIEIIGNRAGLKDLGEICLALSGLTDEEAKTPANHYHIADFMNNAELGSVETLITLNLNL
ncbi:MAG: hypothetical protein OJF52_002389 [Nitrospira sp.]|nr:MAG: hypothetical protein OJF52_002389 [Nitrospira sp.]